MLRRGSRRLLLEPLARSLGDAQAALPGALEVLLANSPTRLCTPAGDQQQQQQRRPAHSGRSSPSHSRPCAGSAAARTPAVAAAAVSSSTTSSSSGTSGCWRWQQQQQQQQQRCAASTSTLRGELGSGSALGASDACAAERRSAAAAGGGDPAQRRQSLLARGGGQRFYDTVRVEPAPADSSGFQLLLRSYPIKTPAKHVLVLPSKSLALAVAAEWEWLPSGRPAPHQMPLTGLACTAIDEPKARARVIAHLLKYVHTDGACIRYEPGPLERRQQATFDPLLSWAAQELGWHLATTHSIFGTTQAPATVAAVAGFLEGLDAWRLAAMDQLTTTSKSLVLAAALLRGRVGVAAAVAAARLEEDFQLEDWGMVEAGHDLDLADARTRLGAAAVFARLLEQP